jgi:ATP-dependent helicase HrpA
LPHREIVEALLDFLLNLIFGPIPPGIVEENTFIEKVADIRARGLYALGKKMLEDFLGLLRKRRTVFDSLNKIFSQGDRNNLYLPDKKAEFSAHLNDVFPTDLLRKRQPVSFSDLDRQLQSLLIRIERFQANPAKDSLKAAPLAKHLRNLAHLAAKSEDLSKEALEYANTYKMMVNEYRIALFSPEIKTRLPISEKKLEEQWRLTLTRC